MGSWMAYRWGLVAQWIGPYMADLVHTPPPSATAPSGKLTYEEFLAWVGDGTFAEWTSGQVIVMSPSSLPHQLIVIFLVRLLGEVVERGSLGVLLAAPFQMKMELSGREPDVLFIAKENLDRLKRNYLEGPADLAIEVISPESRVRDRGEKYYEYEHAGVREYWLVDPDRKQAEFYGLGANNIYQLLPIGPDGFFESVVLKGLRFRVDWLWQEPLPAVRNALRESGQTG